MTVRNLVSGTFFPLFNELVWNLGDAELKDDSLRALDLVAKLVRGTEILPIGVSTARSLATNHRLSQECSSSSK